MSAAKRRKHQAQLPARCDDCGAVWHESAPQCPLCGLAADGSDPLIGQSVGHHLLHQRVKGGLLNVVYQAQDTQRQAQVALKLLHPAALKFLGGTAHVRRLIQQWRQCHHPSAPRILQTFETTDGALCWTSPWLAGTPLLQRLQPNKTPLSIEHIRDITQQLCELLQTMHEQGLVHGQLRPEQIFLQHHNESLRLVLSDLGWGAAIGEHFLRKQHKDEGTMRAMRFLAPEQLLPEITIVPPQADVYATAALLFLLLTRRLPFRGRNWEELYRAHIYAPPPRLNMACPHLRFGDAIEELLRRALAKQPQDRYPTIRTFWAAFEAIDLAELCQTRPRRLPLDPPAPTTTPWVTLNTRDGIALHAQRSSADRAMFLGRKRRWPRRALFLLALSCSLLVLLWWFRSP